MEFFNRFYTPEILQKIKDRIPKDQQSEGVSYFLTGQTEGARIRREAFNKYLEVGYRHNAFDSDLIRRLQSHKFDEFVQARNELMAAWYFEQEANLNIKFRPSGNGNSVGEFSLDVSPEIYVEVKSPWQEVPAGQIVYGHDGPTIRQNVKKALGQLPKDDRANLVVLSGQLKGGLSDPMSGVVQALYGEPVWQVAIGENTMGERVEEAWKLNGIFQPKLNTRISAVATLLELVGSPYLDSCLMNHLSSGEIPVDHNAPMDLLFYSFKVYHNPYAVNPIPPDVFSKWDQLVIAADKSKMEMREGSKNIKG